MLRAYARTGVDPVSTEDTPAEDDARACGGARGAAAATSARSCSSRVGRADGHRDRGRARHPGRHGQVAPEPRAREAAEPSRAESGKKRLKPHDRRPPHRVPLRRPAAGRGRPHERVYARATRRDAAGRLRRRRRAALALAVAIAGALRPSSAGGLSSPAEPERVARDIAGRLGRPTFAESATLTDRPALRPMSQRSTLVAVRRNAAASTYSGPTGTSVLPGRERARRSSSSIDGRISAASRDRRARRRRDLVGIRSRSTAAGRPSTDFEYEGAYLEVGRADGVPFVIGRTQAWLRSRTRPTGGQWARDSRRSIGASRTG